MRQVAVSGLYKAFGAHPVLTGVDLEVPAGSLTAILGPSGSGKTTLLRLLAGFERADAGTISIGGDRGRRPRRLRRPGAAPDRLRAAGGQPVPAPDRGGQRRLRPPRPGPPGRPGRQPCWRRSAWAGSASGTRISCPAASSSGSRWPGRWPSSRPWCCSTSRSPRWTPTCGPASAPTSPEIFRRAGTTAVLVTHDQDEALSVADRVAALRDGKIAQYAPPEELYSRPADAELARFVGEANLLEGVLDGGMVKTLLGNLPVDPAAAPGGGPGHGADPARADRAGGQRGRRGGPGDCPTATTATTPWCTSSPTRTPTAGRSWSGSSAGSSCPVGSPVTLRARGPVFAWPRD